MQVEQKKSVRYVLTLTAEEAQWLQSAMQNPLHGTPYEEEPEVDSRMRESFFNALVGLKEG